MPNQIAAEVLVAFGGLLNAITFCVYVVDKRAARRGRRRVPESRLHALALLGGWPGALVAQRVLYHKTRKQPFRRVFWATVALNCVAVAGVLSLLYRR